MISSRRLFLLILAFTLGGLVLRAAKIGEVLPAGTGLEWPRAEGKPGKIALRLEENKWRLYFLDHNGKVIAPPLPGATLFTDETPGRKNVIYSFTAAPDGLALTSPLAVKPSVKNFSVRLVVSDPKQPASIENYPRTLLTR